MIENESREEPQTSLNSDASPRQPSAELKHLLRDLGYEARKAGLVVSDAGDLFQRLRQTEQELKAAAHGKTPDEVRGDTDCVSLNRARTDLYVEMGKKIIEEFSLDELSAPLAALARRIIAQPESAIAESPASIAELAPVTVLAAPPETGKSRAPRVLLGLGVIAAVLVAVFVGFTREHEVKQAQPIETANPVAEAKTFKDGLLWVEGGDSAPYKLWFRSAGNEAPRLIANDIGGWVLTCSPDGLKVAYQGTSAKEMSFFGTAPHRVVDFQGNTVFSSNADEIMRMCEFSPDGQFYAFAKTETAPSDSTDQRYGLYVVDLGSSDEQVIAHDVKGGKWVPNSGGIVYEAEAPDFGLYYLRVIKGGTAEKLSDRVCTYSLAPSSEWIYFAVAQENSVYPSGHVMMNLTTGQRVDLPSPVSAPAPSAQAPGELRDDFENASWSNEGRFFAYIADGKVMLFDCDLGELVPCALTEGKASKLTLSPKGDSLACVISNADWPSDRLNIWSRRGASLSEIELAPGTPKLQGWLGEQILVTVSGKRYLARPGVPSASPLECDIPFYVWKWPQGEGCMLEQSNGQFRIWEIGLDGSVTEPFPAIGGFAVDLTGADVMTRWLLGIEGLTYNESTYCGAEHQAAYLSSTTNYRLTDLRFASAQGRDPNVIVISVKEQGKAAAQYLLHRNSATPTKIGDFAGAFPYWVQGQEQVLFLVYGGDSGGGIALQLYDIRSNTWTKLADRMAPIQTFMIDFAEMDHWSF